MCTLISLAQATCPTVAGGVRETWITSCDNISSVTWDANNQVTNFTMSTPGTWTRFLYNDDDTAKFDSENTGSGNLRRYTQIFEAYFSGLDNVKRNAAMALDDCCCLVVVHFLNSGLAVVQGIQKLSTAPFFKTTNKRLRSKTSLLHDTGANEDRLKLTMESISTEHHYYTTLTETAIAAL